MTPNEVVDRVRAFSAERKSLAAYLRVNGANLMQIAVINAGGCRALARRTKVSPTYISRISRGHELLRPSALLKIAPLLSDRTSNP